MAYRTYIFIWYGVAGIECITSIFMFYVEQIAGIGHICLNSHINEICQSNNKAVKSNMCRFIDEDKN